MKTKKQIKRKIEELENKMGKLTPNYLNIDDYEGLRCSINSLKWVLGEIKELGNWA